MEHIWYACWWPVDQCAWSKWRHTQKQKQRRIVECIALANLCSPKRLVISLLLCWTSMICTSTICSSPNVKLSISQQTKHIIFIHEKRFVGPRRRTKWRSIQCYFSVDTEKKERTQISCSEACVASAPQWRRHWAIVRREIRCTVATMSWKQTKKEEHSLHFG